MQYVKGIRLATATAAVVSAALAVTACRPGGDTTGSASPSKAPGTAAVSPSPSATLPPSASASSAPSGSSGSPGSSGSSGSSGSGSTASPVAASSGAAVSTCAASALKTSAHQATVRPDGTGTGAAIVEFTNASGTACVLRGHPSVAGAGNGSPEHNSPLSVTPTGPASPVTVAPGGKAWVKLTFVQVQGEGDGYCESGATPASYPTIVVGLPGSGRHQVALDDGVFAECDNTVTVTAVSATKPS